MLRLGSELGLDLVLGLGYGSGLEEDMYNSVIPGCLYIHLRQICCLLYQIKEMKINHLIFFNKPTL